MNRLKEETSPYLLQHANNPVDWYAWKPEAFQKAKAEDKPILLSIGYSTCHWCHVMERESFEDPEIAAYMNTHFVSIKVDREERPDVDQIYMDACQIISGSGGWPLNVFCTPEGKPFYAGTYFPPKGHLNRSSWIQVLHSIERSFREKRNVVEEQAQRLIEIIEKSGERFLDEDLVEKDTPFTNDDLHTMYQGLVARFDTEYGGFGAAPKFPQASNLAFLRMYGLRFEEEQANKHLRLSLDKMIRGGMYDQLGGGFMRYSTDQSWLVPHFEKMLYDNALLLRLLAKVWASSKEPLYLEVIEQTIGYISREMTGPDGGFYSALDADSEGEEGTFYIWTWAEMESLFGDEADLFARYFGMMPGGNWEGKNIVWRLNDDLAFAKAAGISMEAWKAKLEAARSKMFEKRASRIRPGLDDKYLLDWNALLLSGLIEVYLATGLESAKALAVNNLAFLQKTFTGADPGELKHVYSDKSTDGAFYPAFLDDYAYFIEALMLAYQIDFDSELILQASRYSDYLLEHFVEPKTDLFYFTSGNETDLPVRRMDIFDSSLPSGNSVMVRNLLRLELFLGRSKYRLHAESMLKKVLDSLKKYPTALCNWGIGLSETGSSFREIVIIGPKAKAFARQIQQENIEQSILFASESVLEDFPLTENRDSGDGKTWIYLCEDYACQKPVETVESFLALI